MCYNILERLVYFMSVSKAHIKATAKYNANNYDRIEIKVKKGEKAVLQEAAAVKGLSLNAYVLAAIEKYRESSEK